jgi:hypothetical protein
LCDHWRAAEEKLFDSGFPSSSEALHFARARLPDYSASVDIPQPAVYSFDFFRGKPAASFYLRHYFGVFFQRAIKVGV